MKLVFGDLLRDPEVRTLDLAARVLGDMRYVVGGAWLGAVFGFLVVLIWWVNRSDVIPFDPTLGLVLIAALFVAAGFVGALRSGRFAGGISTGFVAGCIGAVTVPGDYLLFRMFPFYDAMSFVLTMAASAAVVMFFVALGAAIHALARRKDPELTS